MIFNIKHYIQNCISRTHALRTTNGKLGHWYDLPERIEDALFTAIIDFVDVECAWMYCISYSVYSLPKNKNLRTDYGIKYLQLCSQEDGFGRVNKIPLDVIEIYRYAKYKRDSLDEYSEERAELDTKYLNKIIEIRKWLWT